MTIPPTSSPHSAFFPLFKWKSWKNAIWKAVGALRLVRLTITWSSCKDQPSGEPIRMRRIGATWQFEPIRVMQLFLTAFRGNPYRVRLPVPCFSSLFSLPPSPDYSVCRKGKRGEQLMFSILSLPWRKWTIWTICCCYKRQQVNNLNSPSVISLWFGILNLLNAVCPPVVISCWIIIGIGRDFSWKWPPFRKMRATGQASSAMGAKIDEHFRCLQKPTRKTNDRPLL